MKFGQGVAFIVGMAVAGFASALLLGGPPNHRPQAPGDQTTAHAVGRQRHADTGEIELTHVPAPAGAFARAGRSLLATLPTSEWFFDEGLGVAVCWSDDGGAGEWQTTDILAFGPPRIPSRRESVGDHAAARCRQSLAQIDTALRVWARATGSPGGTVLPMEELILHFPQLASLPVCPGGGQYLGEDGTAAFAVGEIPRCTLGGSHSIP